MLNLTRNTHVPIRYRVTDPLHMNITNLDEVAKHTVSELFDCFNNAFFTGDMLVSRLNYTEDWSIRCDSV